MIGNGCDPVMDDHAKPYWLILGALMSLAVSTVGCGSLTAGRGSESGVPVQLGGASCQPSISVKVPEQSVDLDPKVRHLVSTTSAQSAWICQYGSTSRFNHSVLNLTRDRRFGSRMASLLAKALYEVPVDSIESSDSKKVNSTSCPAASPSRSRVVLSSGRYFKEVWLINDSGCPYLLGSSSRASWAGAHGLADQFNLAVNAIDSAVEG